MKYLETITAETLRTLYVNGENPEAYASLRDHVRAAVATGRLNGSAPTGTEIKLLDRDACIALLLGQPQAEAAVPTVASVPASAQTTPTAGKLGKLAALEALLCGGVDAEDVKRQVAEAVAPHVAALQNTVASIQHLPAETKAAMDAQIAGFSAQMEAAIKAAQASRPVSFQVLMPGKTPAIVDGAHAEFPTLLSMLAARLNVWLVGPAGAGKTYAATEAARVMGVPFYFNGAIDSEHKLAGFIDAQGRIIRRPFREAWENGGLYLFDEVDASLPSACLAFNAALANDVMDFPDRCIPRHADCHIVAGGNVWNGATSEYCGRMKPDGAFLDRFQHLAWNYDEPLEKRLAASKAAGMAAGIAQAKGRDEAQAVRAAVGEADAWTAYVQAVRANASRHGIKAIFSPRASIAGAVLLAQGQLSRSQIERVTLRKGLDDATWKKLTEGAK